MNERILKLVEQADGVVINKMMTGAKQYTFLEQDLEKFAELIVRECAKVVFEKTGPKSALNVLEHFGVE